jgi:major inositol transporter-like SP family MFS transporter
MGIAVFVLWTTNTIISFVFPLLREAVGATPTFGLFVLVNIASVICVSKFVPRTRGRTLEELKDDIRMHDAAHLVHTAAAGVHAS